MKLNEILKMFENESKFAEMFGTRPYNISVTINDGCSKTFHNSKEFKEYFREEYVVEFNTKLFAVDFEKELGCVKASFFSLNELCTIEIYPTMTY